MFNKCAHIARAALESIAYQSADVLEAMQKDAGQALSELRVDGGAAANDLLMQFQADILGVPVVRPKVLETTALGAAYLAGLHTGVWSSREEIAAQWQMGRRFEPGMARPEAAALLARWREAVSRSRNWSHDNSCLHAPHHQRWHFDAQVLWHCWLVTYERTIPIDHGRHRIGL